jgi:hypothetical protein
MTAMATRPAEMTIEQALVEGDLSNLTPEQRVNYYLQVCESVGLNRFAKPFAYLRLQGGLQLYATKNATDQLRDIHGVSIVGLEREQIGELLVVTATARRADGRTDSSIGAVAVGGLKGESLANAMMKAETKAKRRVTLSLCGLGVLDESEVDSVPGAYRVDVETGEVAASFEPIKDQAPEDDRDMVRNADERIWVNWLKVLARAQGVGLNPQQVILPIDRNELREYGSQVLKDIQQREREAEAVGRR